VRGGQFLRTEGETKRSRKAVGERQYKKMIPKWPLEPGEDVLKRGEGQSGYPLHNEWLRGGLMKVRAEGEPAKEGWRVETPSADVKRITHGERESQGKLSEH